MPPPPQPARSPKRASKIVNNLRIIGGQWRGRKLAVASLPGLRPTPGRVRETLFNWLAPVISGARCLDLFAGSGALGFEAMSRGAAHCTFIDSAAAVTRQLNNHAETLTNGNSAPDRTMKIVQDDALAWLSARQQAETFDIVFIDPPFHREMVNICCELLQTHSLLSNNGLVYIEAERGFALSLPSSWLIHRQKRAGQVDYYLCRFEH